MEYDYFTNKQIQFSLFTNIILQDFVIVRFSCFHHHGLNSIILFQIRDEMSQINKSPSIGLSIAKYLNFIVAPIQDSSYWPYVLLQLSKNLQWFCSLSQINLTFDQQSNDCQKYCLNINQFPNYMNSQRLSCHQRPQYYLNFQNFNFSQYFLCCLQCCSLNCSLFSHFA